jgi:molybdate transport system substrate-binding protein
MSELIIFCAGAVQSIVPGLVQDYLRNGRDTVKFEFGTAGALAHRVAEGAVADVVIGASGDLAALAKAGKVDGASIRDLGSLGVGVAVRAGAALPDIHDVASFQSTLLAAHSVMCGNPAKGGQSGIHIAKVLAKLGLDIELGPKLQLRDSGRDGFVEVANGDIEIGLGQISEIIANKGVVLVGPFPAEIQGGVTFAAAVHCATKSENTAHELIAALVTPAAQEKFKATGFSVGAAQSMTAF